MTRPRFIEGKDAKRPRQPKKPTTSVVDLVAARTRLRPPLPPFVPLGDRLRRAAQTIEGIQAEANHVLFLDADTIARQLDAVLDAVLDSLADEITADERNLR